MRDRTQVEWKNGDIAHTGHIEQFIVYGSNVFAVVCVDGGAFVLVKPENMKERRG